MENGEALATYALIDQPQFTLSVLASIILVVLPLIALLGRKIGAAEYRRWKFDRDKPDRIPGGTSLSAMLALLGLLLAFAFGAGLGWREMRQTAVIEEAAAISSAFLRADLVAEPGRTDLKQALLDYARSRLATPQDVRTRRDWVAFVSRTLDEQARLWPATLSAIGGDTPAPIRATVANGVTDVLDASTRRFGAAFENIPSPVKVMLLLAAGASIFVVGNRSALQGRPLTWRTFMFSGLLSVVIIVIFDLDRSLEGLDTIKTVTLQITIHEMEVALSASKGTGS